MTKRKPVIPEGERTFTRREWMTRHAILNGASLVLAQEAVASVAIEHDWDMDTERKTMAEWDMMENNK